MVRNKLVSVVGVNPPADIASGRIAEVRSRSMSCNCMTRTSQQECLGILERMYYHLIMVVKYRRKVIDDPISERAKEIWERIAPDYGITLEEWNHDVDHVHVMFRAQPKSELGKFINAYKSASSRLLKKEYPQIRERLWKEAFWSQSFCLLTAGGAPVEVIRRYIETQGEKKY